ncbi:MAG: response regulator [Vulcanimicrobiota bacterium]
MQEKIIVLDDNEDFLIIFEAIFKDVFDISTASTIRELVRKLEKQKFDLIIVDHTMPRIEGLELIKILHRAIPEMAIILCSGTRNQRVIREAFECCATGFVSKENLTYNKKNELAERIFKIIEKHRTREVLTGNINLLKPLKDL